MALHPNGITIATGQGAYVPQNAGVSCVHFPFCLEQYSKNKVCSLTFRVITRDNRTRPSYGYFIGMATS